MPKGEDLTIYNTNETDFQCLQLKLKEKIDDVSKISIKGRDLSDFTAVSMSDDNSSVYLMMKFKSVKKKYKVKVTFDAEKETPEFKNILSSGKLSMFFSSKGKLAWVVYDGKRIGNDEFLQSFITYDGKKYDFSNISAKALVVAGTGEGVRLKGEIHLPGEIESGSFTYDFFTGVGSDAIFVRTTVNYPYTPELVSISTENSSLGRYTDMKWQETVPFQITPDFKGDISVIKRNFMDDISSFRTQSFPECDSKNEYVASFNHQLTAGMVGLSDENCGLIIANARQVLCSMAHCPMRLEKDKTVRMNPFGTYYGKQRHHRGRAKDQGLDAYTLVAAQGKSIAPSYNGTRETAILGIYGFGGNVPEESLMKEICAFADGCVGVASEASAVEIFYEDNVGFREYKKDNKSEKDLKNPVMTGLMGNLGEYIYKGIRGIGHIVITQLKTR